MSIDSEREREEEKKRTRAKENWGRWTYAHIAPTTYNLVIWFERLTFGCGQIQFSMEQDEKISTHVEVVKNYRCHNLPSNNKLEPRAHLFFFFFLFHWIFKRPNGTTTGREETSIEFLVFLFLLAATFSSVISFPWNWCVYFSTRSLSKFIN